MSELEVKKISAPTIMAFLQYLVIILLSVIAYFSSESLSEMKKTTEAVNGLKIEMQGHSERIKVLERLTDHMYKQK